MIRKTISKIFYCSFLIVSLFSSCKKESSPNDSFVLATEQENLLGVQEAKIIFSKALAISVAKQPVLRTFLKNEALKRFDLDNDILFQMVKDEKIDSGKTFYDLLTQYAESKEKLDLAIISVPTLTIMIPELPNFSPNAWNSELEVPLVAISPESRQSDVEVYDSEGMTFKIEPGSIPGFPVVVVKENERINVKVNGIDKSPRSSASLRSENSPENDIFLVKGNMKFSFSNDAFNGFSKKDNGTIKDASNGRTEARIDYNITWSDGSVDKTAHPIDPIVIEAFNKQLDWQRDFVYYGLDPASGKDKGKFNNNAVEHIISIRMKSDLELQRISDQPVDPSLVEVERPDASGVGTRIWTEWTDGYFDIRISVLINAKNGAGTQLTKVISARGSDLFDILYKPRYSGGVPPGSQVYDFDKIVPKDFFINEPLVAWDLENYGTAFKFIVSEYDPSEEIITTENSTTKFASNFSFDIGWGEKVKLGAKYGQTTETTSSSTYQYKTTRGSDELGEGILEFGSPIILKNEPPVPTGTPRPPRPGAKTLVGQNWYFTNEVSCGAVLLCVEPKVINRTN